MTPLGKKANFYVLRLRIEELRCAVLCWYEGGRVKVMRKPVFLPQLIQLDTATPRYTATRAHLRI